MGYAKRPSLGTSVVHAICGTTGYPVDEYGHLLRTRSVYDGTVVPGWDRPGTKLYNWTSPYGRLHYAIGSGDDFWCFDWERINAGPRGEFTILHATINSETAGFVQNGGYYVLPSNSREEQRRVLHQAMDLMCAAENWCLDNDVRHTTRGWSQTPAYFVLSLAESYEPGLFKYRGNSLQLRRNNLAALKRLSSILYLEK